MSIEYQQSIPFINQHPDLKLNTTGLEINQFVSCQQPFDFAVMQLTQQSFLFRSISSWRENVGSAIACLKSRLSWTLNYFLQFVKFAIALKRDELQLILQHLNQMSQVDEDGGSLWACTPSSQLQGVNARNKISEGCDRASALRSVHFNFRPDGCSNQWLLVHSALLLKRPCLEMQLFHRFSHSAYQRLAIP